MYKSYIKSIYVPVNIYNEPVTEKSLVRFKQKFVQIRQMYHNYFQTFLDGTMTT